VVLRDHDSRKGPSSRVSLTTSKVLLSPRQAKHSNNMVGTSSSDPPPEHDVIDVRLQRHADVLPLLRLKLEDVQNARYPHLEKDRRAAAAELHDVTELRRVEVLLGCRPEEVHLMGKQGLELQVCIESGNQALFASLADNRIFQKGFRGARIFVVS
jgi:hypothetical protein